MRIGIVVFPGSNCDHDAEYAFSRNLGAQTHLIWHQESSLGNINAVVLPGGFSFGDYLRCGAIAKFSRAMAAVKKFAAEGGLVLGLCNGFQILTESGLLPGALVANQRRRYVCRRTPIEVVSNRSPFTHLASAGQRLELPIGHGEGCYVADRETLDRLEREDRVIFRYLDNPNGSERNIAGIVNEGGNVLGMMPHPERASDPVLGTTDGLVILQSVIASVKHSVAV